MTDSAQHSLTIVIPTYNQSALLKECLESLAAQTYQDFDVVVVDDASAEDIPKTVSAVSPNARVIRMEKNSGFACAVNAGLQSSTAPRLMLLNNDMTLEPDCLEKLIATMDASSADMLTPLVLFRDEPETIYSAGDLLRTSGRPESIGFRRPRTGFKHPPKVFGVTGGAALYAREVFDQIGYFDERFVAYFEDSDLSFRARLAGFTAACVPETVAYHVGGASLDGRTAWRTRQCARNHMLLIMKNMPIRLIIRLAPSIIKEHFHQLGRVISTVRAESGLLKGLVELVRVRWELFCLIPHMLRERKRIQRARKIMNQELRSMLTKGNARTVIQDN